MATFALKRVYEAPAKTEGYRVLVDRLWPRGLAKKQAALNLWLKDIAPSPELRNWFNHDPARFAEFTARYEDELSRNAAVAELRAVAKENNRITLLYAARDPVINHAQVLLTYLAE